MALAATEWAMVPECRCRCGLQPPHDDKSVMTKAKFDGVQRTLRRVEKLWEELVGKLLGKQLVVRMERFKLEAADLAGKLPAEKFKALLPPEPAEVPLQPAGFNFVLGEPMTPSRCTSFRPEVRAEDCDHPVCMRKDRGNQYKKWTTCTKCGSRWTREDNATRQPPMEYDTVPDGVFKGKKYSEVLDNHPAYVGWALRTYKREEGVSDWLGRFVEWLRQDP